MSIIPLNRRENSERRNAMRTRPLETPLSGVTGVRVKMETKLTIFYTAYRFQSMCPGSGSNRHALRRALLRGVCLPFHHPGISNTEATAGIEPAHRSFADSCLTTWLHGPIAPKYRSRGAFFQPSRRAPSRGLPRNGNTERAVWRASL